MKVPSTSLLSVYTKVLAHNLNDISISMPRHPYHYNDTAVKLPGYIVAMATVCAAESLIVVLGYRYFLAWETPPYIGNPKFPPFIQ